MILLASICLNFIKSQFASPPLLTGIGNYHRRVDTRNSKAQTYFDQGLALLYAFHKSESGRYFAEATQLDPNCAMGWWGQAMAVGPDINFTGVNAEASKTAIAALGHARNVSKNPLESALIQAASLRFSPSAPENRMSLDKAYASQMARLYRAHKHDPDVASLYAESLLILSPWHQWERSGKPVAGTMDAIAALQQALKDSPDHLMANHLWIHTMEASPHPELALPQADKLCQLAPKLGHLVHMPSHIYIRTGRWDQSIFQNDKAITSDRAFAKVHGLAPTYLGYLAHNRMMLAFSANMNGNYVKAKNALADWTQIMPADKLKAFAPMIDGLYWMPLETEKRFGNWTTILRAPEPADCLPISRAMRHYVRAIAYAALHRPAEADRELSAFLAAKAAIKPDAPVLNNTAGDIFSIAEHQARGELMVLTGKLNAGILELKKAVAFEDQLNYDEPPDWLQPTRHTLGAALLKAGKPTEAQAVYLQDLNGFPGNAWSTLGMSQAYAALGNQKLAASWRSKYLKIWSKADPLVDTSCLCLPGKG